MKLLECGTRLALFYMFFVYNMLILFHRKIATHVASCCDRHNLSETAAIS